MKTDSKGKLAIEITEGNNRVIFHPVDNTVWMDRNELCELFGCYMRDIDRCIGEIFEKNLLRMEETCKYHIIAGGKRISYDITTVNLVVIITMAFRLGTPEAKTLREWFLEQFANMKCFEAMFPDVGEKFRWN